MHWRNFGDMSSDEFATTTIGTSMNPTDTPDEQSKRPLL